MATAEDLTFDLDSVSLEEMEQIDHILEIANQGCLRDVDGREVRFPAALYDHLVQVVKIMKQGRAFVMLPKDEPFTTQAAADFLGVSRQHLVERLEAGDIPFHRVGSHRRVLLKDLLVYQTQRDAERRTGMKTLMDQIDRAGLY